MLKFIHFSDCHLLAQNDESLHRTTPFESLSRVIDHIKREQENTHFILVTGDISQDGSNESYQHFLKLLTSLNKPMYCLPGNHDAPELLKQINKTSPDKAISVNLIQGHLLILLNSHVKNKEYGFISENQLQQLNNILTNKHQRPVIIALHHHPVKINSPWMDEINLRNSDLLMTLLKDFSAVKIILFGHVHQEVESTFQQIKILGTPSTCYQFKPQTQTMMLDDRSPGYRSITLLNDGTVETWVHRIQQ